MDKRQAVKDIVAAQISDDRRVMQPNQISKTVERAIEVVNEIEVQVSAPVVPIPVSQLKLSIPQESTVGTCLQIGEEYSLDLEGVQTLVDALQQWIATGKLPVEYIVEKP